MDLLFILFIYFGVEVVALYGKHFKVLGSKRMLLLASLFIDSFVEEQLLFKVVNLSTPWRMREEYMKYISLSSFLTYLLAWLVSKKSISISSHLCLPCFCFVFGLSCLTFVLAVLMGSRYQLSTRCLFFFCPLLRSWPFCPHLRLFPHLKFPFFLKKKTYHLN